MFDTLLISYYIIASNLRGEDTDSRELQTVIYGSSRGRGRGRSTGKSLFIVEDDNDRSTNRCADDTADEFDRNFGKNCNVIILFLFDTYTYTYC